MTDKNVFFETIDQLNTGQRAALRRAAGKTIASAGGQARGAFYYCAPPVPESMEERWFACACLHCLTDADASQRRPLPEIIGEMRRTEQLSDSQINRVLGMLDTAWRSDGYLLAKVTRLVRMLQQRGYAVDCEALLTDLENWNRSDQIVQRRWGRSIFRTRTTEPEEAEKSKEEL